MNHLRGVELVPLAGMSDSELEVTARDLQEMMVGAPVQKYLEERYLPGVIAHNQTESGSLAHLRELRRQMTRLEISAFIIKDIGAGGIIGQAARTPDVHLRKQRTMMEPKSDRRLHELTAGELQDMQLLGANVMAWVDVSMVSPEAHDDILRGIYGELRQGSFAPVWTIEPAGSPLDAVRILPEAGYEHNPVNVGHYDHRQSDEVSVPISRLFTAPAGAVY